MNKKWLKEPDEHSFEYEGFKCSLRRNMMGCWCGYVEIPKGNKFFRTKRGTFSLDLYGDIDVHGGITYAHREKYKSYVTIGFDCAHYGDFFPKIDYWDGVIKDENLRGLIDLQKQSEMITYKDMEFAIDECKRIVDQIKE